MSLWRDPYPPLVLHLLLRLFTWPLHRLPIGAPGPLIPGCVGWYFESVVGQILDSGYRLKGFEFNSSCCTSYPGCLQLVTLYVFPASYPLWFFSHVMKIGTTSVSHFRQENTNHSTSIQEWSGSPIDTFRIIYSNGQITDIWSSLFRSLMQPQLVIWFI
jgi:hypothetical protein